MKMTILNKNVDLGSETSQHGLHQQVRQLFQEAFLENKVQIKI